MKNKGQLLLGVNIDHVATIRQARKTAYPDPVYAALEAQRAGADGITLHVREDRRHVNERDLERMLEMCQIPVNLEMAATDEMVDMCVKHKPPYCCIVPEKREELTTEGGLDTINHFAKIKAATAKLQDNGVEVSLFVEPSLQHIEAAFEAGADSIEIHTGHFADAPNQKAMQEALISIEKATQVADDMGLKVNAGHGLHIHNVSHIAKIPQIIELNIGHSIIAMSMIDGMYNAVRRFKQVLEHAR